MKKKMKRNLLIDNYSNWVNRFSNGFIFMILILVVTIKLNTVGKVQKLNKTRWEQLIHPFKDKL